MRVIALATLKAFLSRSPAYADASEPVMAWYRQVKAADWVTPADVKRDVRSASVLKDGRVVFNIAGNKYRIVVWIITPIVSSISGSSARTGNMIISTHKQSEGMSYGNQTDQKYARLQTHS